MRTTNRPIFLNIVSIRLPIPGIVSILHHISGVLLLASLPLLLWLFSGTIPVPTLLKATVYSLPTYC